MNDRTEGSVERLLTTDEVAEMLSVSPETVRRLMYAKVLSAVKVGKQTRFLRKDVAAYIERNREGGDGHG